MRAGSEDRLCPERNIRANELDEYVFEQVRQVLLAPDQLLAAERAVLTGRPTRTSWWPRSSNTSTQPSRPKSASALACLTPTKPGCWDSKSSPVAPVYWQPAAPGSRERRRHAASAHRAGRPEPHAPPTRRIQRPRRRLTRQPYFPGRRRLVRLVVERVCVTGWRVEIHLKIPLPNEPPPDENRPDHPPSGPHPSTLGPHRPKPPSSDVRLRSDHRDGPRTDPPADHPAPARATPSPTTGTYLEGISSEEIIGAIHGRKAPMMHASTGLEL